MPQPQSRRSYSWSVEDGGSEGLLGGKEFGRLPGSAP